MAAVPFGRARNDGRGGIGTKTQSHFFFFHRDGVHVNSKTCSGVEIGQEVRKTDYMCECSGQE